MTLAWNPFALAPLATASLTIALGLLVASRRLRGPTFAPIALAAGGWSLAVALIVCTEDEATALVASRLALTGIMAAGFFAMRYVVAFARVSRARFWSAAAAVPTLAGAALVWFDPEMVAGVWRPPWGGLYPRLGEHWWVMLAMALGGVVVPAAIAGRAWLSLPPSRRRRQAAYITLAYLAACAGGIDVLGTLEVPLLPLTWATTGVSCVLFYYAVVRWRLADMQTAVHRTLAWAIIVAATLVPLYLFALATAEWPGWLQWQARALTVATLLVLLLFYVARVEPLALGLLSRRGERLAAVVESFTARTAGVARPDELLAPLGDALQQLAQLELVAVRLDVDAGGQRLELRLGGQAQAAGAGADAPDAPLEAAVPGEPLSRTELDPEAPSPPEQAMLALCDAHRADVVLPLRYRDAALGVVLARQRGRSQGFDEVTREALARLAVRAAVAFINAALEEALARRSARLEQEVEERTRELKRAVEELKAAQAQLVQAERQSSLGVLVAGVSHEINNALNFIFGNLPMMSRAVEEYVELYQRAAGAGASVRAELVRAAEKARAELAPALAAIEAGALRARGIVGDLRRFARADDGERRATDVREGLESTLNLLASELSGRIEVERRYARTLPAVDGFPSALNHVFLNVLLNAVQAITERGGRITVDAGVDEAGRVQVAIADTGPGVPEPDRERAFEPFWTTRPQAAGLGLAVCRQIVARHGGEIRLGDNPDGRGARVTIALPAATV